jgi:hypothetical protein
MLSNTKKILIGTIIIVVVSAVFSILSVLNSLTDAQDSTIEASVKSSMAFISFHAVSEFELFDSYSRLCEDSSVKQILNTDIGQANCSSGEDWYVAYVQLGNGKYHCLDATGSAGEIDNIPSGTICGVNDDPDVNTDSIEERLKQLPNVDPQVLDTNLIQTINDIHATRNEYLNQLEGSFFGFCNSPDVVVITIVSEYDWSNAISCIDSSERYRISAELIEGGYYCVDSSGYTGDQSIKPTGESCL